MLQVKDAISFMTGVSARPSFVLALYPGPTPFETVETRRLFSTSRLHGVSQLCETEPPPVHPPVPADAPPCFLTSAGIGDTRSALWATQFFTSMLLAAIPNTELHVYGEGGHGGGVVYPDRSAGLPFGEFAHRVRSQLSLCRVTSCTLVGRRRVAFAFYRVARISWVSHAVVAIMFCCLESPKEWKGGGLIECCRLVRLRLGFEFDIRCNSIIVSKVPQYCCEEGPRSSKIEANKRHVTER